MVFSPSCKLISNITLRKEQVLSSVLKFSYQMDKIESLGGVRVWGGFLHPYFKEKGSDKKLNKILLKVSSPVNKSFQWRVPFLVHTKRT